MKNDCYENLKNYMECLEVLKAKMNPRNREHKRFKIIKNKECKMKRKSMIGYTDNLIEYLNWNMGMFEHWGMLPIEIEDRKLNTRLTIYERENWRKIVLGWLNRGK